MENQHIHQHVYETSPHFDSHMRPPRSDEKEQDIESTKKGLQKLFNALGNERVAGDGRETRKRAEKGLNSAFITQAQFASEILLKFHKRALGNSR